MKKYFFSVTLVILVGQLACGEAPEGDVSEGDAGADSLSLRSDAFAPRADSLSPGCAVPEPRVKSVWGAIVTTSPRGGYRTIDVSPSCSASYFPVPADCSRPVDGFSDGKTSWCCVSTVRGADGSYHMAREHVTCFSDSMTIVPVKAPGNVALCSLEGKFVGWDCMDGF